MTPVAQLSDKATRLLCALLVSGSGAYTTVELGEMAGVSRPRVYEALEEVIEAGYVSLVKEGYTNQIALIASSALPPPSPVPVQVTPMTASLDLYAEARRADASGQPEDRFAVVRKLWDVVFPEQSKVWPVTDRVARDLYTAAGSVAGLYEYVMPLKERAKNIQHPRTYVLAMINSKAKDKPQPEEESVDEGLWREVIEIAQGQE